MEKISDQAKPIGSFWKKYHRRSILLIISTQFACFSLIVGALLAAGIVLPTNISFWIVMIGAFIVFLIVQWAVLFLTGEPFRQLLAALTHSNGEPTITTPPNPNDKGLVNSGLGPVIQYVYELTSRDKEPEKAPSAASLQLDDTFDNTSSAVVILDENSDIIFSSKSAPLVTDTSGKKRLELQFYTDTPLTEWMDNCKENSVHAERVWKRIATKPLGEEDRLMYDITASYQKGSAAPFVLVFTDKTTEYAPEDEDLNFIAFAAHELRGPITVIRGYLDTLNDELRDSVETEQQELFDRLIVSANRLSSYINNILNSSKYDRRHLKIHLVETSINTIYGLIADDMQLRASAQHRLLSVNLPNDLPTIAADATSVSEVLGNLIDNAIKYSNEGGAIEVGAEAHSDHLEIYVKDQGIGMPANVVGNLFHKFYRSHRSRETVAGTGIGLYISKAIVESHGGEMEVKSVEGEGSRFMFTLPLYASVADKLAQTSGDNKDFIRDHTGSWIKNHGSFRG